MPSTPPRVTSPRINTASKIAPFELPVALYLAVLGGIGLVLGDSATPNTLDDAFPDWLVITWSASLAIGGLSTVAGLVRQINPLESIGLVLLAWACALYGVAIPLGAGAVGIAASLAYWTLVSGCALRLRVLRKDRAVRTWAGSVLRDRGDL